MIKTLLNPNHVLSDCDNISDTDGQRMATVLGKHIYGYKPSDPDKPVVKVLGLDENDDVRWNAAQSPGGTPYTGGNGIRIHNHVVSIDPNVVQEKLTAGQNIALSQDNVITATDTQYTAGSGLALDGTEFSNTAPNVKSDWNAAAGSDAEILNKPFVSKVVYSDWQGDFGYDVNIPELKLDSESHKVSGAGYDLGVLPPYPGTTESGNRALMLSSQSRVPGWQSVYSKSETDTLLGSKQSTLTAGTNVQISNNVVSATDSHRPIQVNGTQILGDNASPLNLKAGSNVTITASSGGNVSIAAKGQEQSDWTETDSAKVSFIAHKPNLRYKGADASSFTDLTGMSVDRTATVSDQNVNIAGIAFQDSSIAAGYLIPSLWKEFLNSASYNYGDSNHPAFVQHDSYGRLYFKRGQRTYWEFNYTNPTVTLTAQDISRDYAEFPLALTSHGLKIVDNNDMITIKGHNISMGNVLNNKQLSLYLKPHGSPDDSGWFICDGMTTYTETVVSNYDWKAFKGWGLTASNNVSAVDAYLRVPLNGSGAEGDTFRIDGKISISIFGVAKDDPT